MQNCVICNRKVSKGAFSTKDKFELLNHDFICKDCAAKIGITSIWSATTYTAEKARAKYFELYPEETGVNSCKVDLDNEYIVNKKTKAQKNRRRQPKPRKKGGCLTTVLICLAIIIALGNIGQNENNNEDTSSTPETTINDKNESSKNNNAAEEPVVKLTDLEVGTVVEVGDLEIGLSYVKRSGSHTDAMGSNVEVAAGDEVIYAFFEVHNAGEKLLNISKNKVSAYADSTKIEAVPDYMLFEEDNIKEYQSYEIDGGKYAIVPFNFEVKKGWETVTIFYDDYSWTIDATDVTNNPYTFVSLFEHEENFVPTQVGDSKELSKYTLKFDGVATIPQKYSWSGPWVAFKFTLNNTDSEELDLGLVGYEMRGYLNDYLTDDASYTLDDNLNGYINIFNVEEVKPGMNAKVYVAFEIQETHGQFSMAFDDGYIFHNTAWMINAEN